MHNVIDYGVFHLMNLDIDQKPYECGNYSVD